MTTYSFSDARRNLSEILNQSLKKGKIYIRKKDGSLFIVMPFKKSGSPLDVKGIDIQISKKEIIGYLKEVRER